MSAVMKIAEHFFPNSNLLKIGRVISFLRRFDYHKEAAERLGVSELPGPMFLKILGAIASDSAVRDNLSRLLSVAIERLREDYHITIGEPGTLTEHQVETVLNSWRCGCIQPMARRRPGAGSDTYPEFHEACQLKIKVYANFSGIQGISPSRALELWLHSWDMYAEKFNLGFEWVTSQAQAHVYAYVGPAEPGVLAWMEMFDGCVGLHESRYNRSVHWDEPLALSTMIHENGHGLGIEHSPPGVRSIMAPVADASIPNIIDDWLTGRLAPRYGVRPVVTPVPDPIPVPVPPTDPPTNGGFMTIPWEEIFAAILTVIKACQSKEEARKVIRTRPLRASLLLRRQLVKQGHSRETVKAALKQAREEADEMSDEELNELIEEAHAGDT